MKPPTPFGQQRTVGTANRLLLLLLTSVLLLTLGWHLVWMPARSLLIGLGQQPSDVTTKIIVITPTHKRPERLADMTRFAQTLMHVRNLHWLVVEDGNGTVPAVQRIIDRSGLPSNYIWTKSAPGFSPKGWTQRNVALNFVRQQFAHLDDQAVVYFADDDNSYDIRLFDLYLRKIKGIGVWAVGLAGGAAVEAPRVAENGTVVGWDVKYAPEREFGVDMAGFGINLQQLLVHKNASFGRACIGNTPETCFLKQFGIPRERLEPFGWNEPEPRELLIWHTRTTNIGTSGSNHGYVSEA